MNLLIRCAIALAPFVGLALLDRVALHLSLGNFLMLSLLFILHGVVRELAGYAAGLRRAVLTEAERHEMFMHYVKENYEIVPKSGG